MDTITDAMDTATEQPWTPPLSPSLMVDTSFAEYAVEDILNTAQDILDAMPITAPPIEEIPEEAQRADKDVALDFLKHISTGEEIRPKAGENEEAETEDNDESQCLVPALSEEVRTSALDFLRHIREKIIDTIIDDDKAPDSPLLAATGWMDESIVEAMPVHNRKEHFGVFRDVIGKSSAMVHVTKNAHSLFSVASIIRFDDEKKEEEEEEGASAGRSDRLDSTARDTEAAWWLSYCPWQWGAVEDVSLVDEDGAEPKKKSKGTSYVELLNEDEELLPKLYANLTNEDGMQDPFLLDDPDLRHGKDQSVLRFPGWTVSVIPFVNERDLKSQLNEQFMAEHEENFPGLKSSGLSLSKIRNIKRIMAKTGMDEALGDGLEVSTIALAQLYFDLLILKNRDKESVAQGKTGLVVKENRRLYASVCLILATKYNDPKAEERGAIRVLLDLVEHNFNIAAAEVVKKEFAVFVELNFGLHAHPTLVIDVFERLLKETETPVQEYLEDMYEVWEEGRREFWPHQSVREVDVLAF